MDSPFKKSLFRKFVYLGLIFTASFYSFSALAAPPTFTAIFSPSSIAPSGVATMTYTINNSANSSGVTSLAFSNTLPAGMTVASPANASTVCVNGSFSAISGSSVIAFNDYRLGAGSSCAFSVDVTSSTLGTHTNTTGALTSSAGDSGSASADLIVDNSGLQLSMSLADDTLVPGQVTTLTYTLDGSELASNVISISMSHSLSGLTISTAPNITSSCGDFIVSAEAGSTSLSFNSGFNTSSGWFNAGASCIISVDVKASEEAGTYTASAPGITYYLANFSVNTSNSASVALTVQLPLMYASFPDSAVPGSSVALSFSLTNFSRSDITNLNFSNDLNATLTGLAATVLPADDFCGSGSIMTGSSNLTIAGVNLASGDSCSFSVTVLIPSAAAVGSYTNTTSSLNYDLDGNATTEVAFSHNMLLQAAPTLTASFLTSPVSAGDTLSLRYTITNTDAANAATDISFSMPINDIVSGTVINTLPSSNSCGSGSTFTSAGVSFDSVSFSLTNGLLDAGASCTFDLVLTLASNATTGSHDFTTSIISASVSGDEVFGIGASDTLEIAAAPSLALSISETSVAPGGTVSAEFTLSYSANASADVTDVGFTVDLDGALAGLTSISETQSNVCGSGSSFSGTTSLILSGATLEAGGEPSCTFSVTLQIPDETAPGLITLSSSAVTGTTSGISVSNSAGTDDLTISGLTFSKSFIGDPALPGSTISLQYTITNAASASAASNMIFTDNLSSVISTLNVTDLPSTPCGAGSAISGTTFLIFTGGSLAAEESCTFSMTLNVPSGAVSGDYNSNSSALSATVDSINTINEAAIDVLSIEELTVSLYTSASNPTQVSPIPVSIYFSRAVIGFALEDVSVENGVASNFSVSDGFYTVDITPDGVGTVLIDIASNVVVDEVVDTVVNSAATQLSLSYYNTGVTVLPPSLIISAPSSSAAGSGPVTYSVSYSNVEKVNLTADAIILYDNDTGTDATVTVTEGTVTEGNTANATVTLSNITGNGTLGISVAAETARNATGPAPAVGPSTSFTVDNTAPTVTITDAVADPYNATFTATITFNEDVTGFEQADITAGNANLSDFAVTSASVYTVLVAPINPGVVTLDVAENVAVDGVSNGNSVATQHTVTFDNVAPTVGITGSMDVNAAFTATITFSEDVSGFTLEDITAGNASLCGFSATSESVYTVLMMPISEGAVTLDIAANVATDAALNNNSAATQFSASYDKTAPSVTITDTVADPYSSAFTATITFSEDVSDFTQADITAGNASLSDFAVTSASVYTVLVTPTIPGVVTLDVAANVAIDSASNGNTAATQHSLTFDNITSCFNVNKLKNDKVIVTSLLCN